MADQASPTPLDELRRRFLAAGGCPHCWPLEADDMELVHRVGWDPVTYFRRNGLSDDRIVDVGNASRRQVE
jgi:hypothetical protein